MLSMEWGFQHQREMSKPVTANNKGKFKALFELYKTVYADTPNFWTSIHYDLGLHARRHPGWQSVADTVFKEGFAHFSRGGIKGVKLEDFSSSSARHFFHLRDYVRAEEQVEIAMKIRRRMIRKKDLRDLLSHQKLAADIYYHSGAYSKARKVCDEMFESAKNLDGSDAWRFRFEDRLKYEGMLHRLEKHLSAKHDESKMAALFSNVQRG